MHRTNRAQLYVFWFVCWRCCPGTHNSRESRRNLLADIVNARAETVATKPFFRGPFKRTRCLIPVSGYYEWQETSGGKQPWYFSARDGSPALTVPGLWDEWKDPGTGKPLKSCTAIICQPNDFVAKVHDRMPVLLSENDFEP